MLILLKKANYIKAKQEYQKIICTFAAAITS